jgi:hypothetical protein
MTARITKAVQPLVRSIIHAFGRKDRSCQGNKALCPNLSPLAEWLREDGVQFNDRDLAKALEALSQRRVGGILDRLVPVRDVLKRLAPEITPRFLRYPVARISADLIED